MTTHDDQQQVLGDAIRLSQDLTGIVRREMTGVIDQLTSEAERAGVGVGFISAGGALGYAALLMGLWATAELLSALMPRWLAGVLVSGGAAALALNLARRGRNDLQAAGIHLEHLASSSADR
jgi:hypothetical protein